MQGRKQKLKTNRSALGSKVWNYIFRLERNASRYSAIVFLCFLLSLLWGSAYTVACFIFTFPTLEEVSFVLDFAVLCGILLCRLNGITRLCGGLPMRNGFKHFSFTLTLWLATNGRESEMKKAFRCPQLIQCVLQMKVLKMFCDYVWHFSYICALSGVTGLLNEIRRCITYSVLV